MLKQGMQSQRRQHCVKSKKNLKMPSKLTLKPYPNLLELVKNGCSFSYILNHLKQRNLEKLKDHLNQQQAQQNQGGDWERKNKLKIYERIYGLMIRDIQKLANYFQNLFNCQFIRNYLL
ncbi:unnamed protein product [Paramecium pentaurelia]|uniref:26S proteasome regulatory subunit Rpn7 N-terminal domain-containing protein n=1 Tax=Paramecium pentaurelia TaxID=43138 RepID=A0A8S1YND9_9CILI|nr:unnamed protein product [Paramecium pentaurelia]